MGFLPISRISLSSPNPASLLSSSQWLNLLFDMYKRRQLSERFHSVKIVNAVVRQPELLESAGAPVHFLDLFQIVAPHGQDPQLGKRERGIEAVDAVGAQRQVHAILQLVQLVVQLGDGRHLRVQTHDLGILGGLLVLLRPRLDGRGARRHRCSGEGGAGGRAGGVYRKRARVTVNQRKV